MLTRAEQNTGIYVFSSIITTVVTIISNTVLVCIFKQGLKGLLISMLAAHLVSDLFMFLMQPGLRRFSWKSGLKSESGKELLMYSLLLIPNSISFWILNSSDRLLIKFFIGSSANGIYAISNKFPGLIQILANVFIQAFTEQAILTEKADDRLEYYSGLFHRLYTVLFTSVAVLIPMTKYMIMYLMESGYRESYKYAGFLYIAIVFFVFTGFYGTEYIAKKKSSGAFLTTMIGALLNIAVNLALINKIGIYAAALSTMISYIALWGIRVYSLRASFKLKIDYKLFGCFFVMDIAFSLAVIQSNWLADIILTFVSLVVFIVFNRDTIEKIGRRLVRNCRKRKRRE